MFLTISKSEIREKIPCASAKPGVTETTEYKVEGSQAVRDGVMLSCPDGPKIKIFPGKGPGDPTRVRVVARGIDVLHEFYEKLSDTNRNDYALGLARQDVGAALWDVANQLGFLDAILVHGAEPAWDIKSRSEDGNPIEAVLSRPDGGIVVKIRRHDSGMDRVWSGCAGCVMLAGVGKDWETQSSDALGLAKAQLLSYQGQLQKMYDFLDAFLDG